LDPTEEIQTIVVCSFYIFIEPPLPLETTTLIGRGRGRVDGSVEGENA